MHFETLAIHASQPPDPSTGAIMTPVYLTSTYVQDGPGEHRGFEYSRTGNPTRHALEGCLAALEGAKFGFAFASGCAATDAVMHLLRAGDHVVVSDDVYGGTFRLFTKMYEQLGILFSFVDLCNLEAFERSLTPSTKLVWVETPTNPLLKIIDLERISSISRKRGILTACDNTFMSPYFQRPLDFGFDLVVHSTTKFLNGHSDVVGGFVATSHEELGPRLAFVQNAVGAIPGPLDCFLVLRGLKTLPVRMERHASNAMAVADFLCGHPKVATVTYPGLQSHPQHAIAKRQGSGFGAMLTFEVKGGLSAARALLKQTKIFACAESLGGVESLIEHPAIMTHASIPKETRQSLGILDGLIRVSVGIEHIADLIDDLRGALDAA